MRTVKWSIRDDGNSTWCKHYHDPYVVFVTDCDGDGVEWSVWIRSDLDAQSRALDRGDRDAVLRFHPQAKGEVISAYDELLVGQAIAIEALDALLRDGRLSEAAVSQD